MNSYQLSTNRKPAFYLDANIPVQWNETGKECLHVEILNKLYTLRNNALKAGVNPNKFKKIYKNNNVKVKEKEKNLFPHSADSHSTKLANRSELSEAQPGRTLKPGAQGDDGIPPPTQQRCRRPIQVLRAASISRPGQTSQF